MHEAAVGRSVHPGSGIDSHNPQSAKITFALPAVSIRIPQAFQQCFICPPIQAVPAAKLPLRHLEDFLVAQMPV